MIAVKENRVYQIDQSEKEARRAAGFDIYDDDGNLIAYSLDKKVAYDQYAAALEEIGVLKAEIEQLKAAAGGGDKAAEDKATKKGK